MRPRCNRICILCAPSPCSNFIKRAFGAEELGRHATPDGVIHHATVKIGNAHMEMGDAHGPYQPMPTMFYLYVEDCDALYKRALAARERRQSPNRKIILTATAAAA